MGHFELHWSIGNSVGGCLVFVGEIWHGDVVLMNFNRVLMNFNF